MFLPGTAAPVLIGVPGRSYNIERAPAVAGPWSAINTQAAPACGFLESFGPDSPAGAAFYRIKP